MLPKPDAMAQFTPTIAGVLTGFAFGPDHLASQQGQFNLHQR